MKIRILSMLFLLVCGSAAWAQSTGAEITGTITDGTGSVVPNAAVVITNTQTNLQRSLNTNASGVYDAPSLQPGVYSVKVTAQGFRTDVRSEVEMQVGQVARLDFQLQVGNV